MSAGEVVETNGDLEMWLSSEGVLPAYKKVWHWFCASGDPPTIKSETRFRIFLEQSERELA